VIAGDVHMAIAHNDHYSIAHEPATVLKWCRELAPAIYKTFTDAKRFPCFVYSGMSGTSLATALLMYMHTEYPTYVRKEGERSHSDHRVEFSYPVSNVKYELLFVDDFISSGETLKRCIHSVKHKVNSIKDMMYYMNTASGKEMAKVLKELKINFKSIKFVDQNHTEIRSREVLKKV
jgi:orotate phosphoribosyltransferase